MSSTVAVNENLVPFDIGENFVKLIPVNDLLEHKLNLALNDSTISVIKTIIKTNPIYFEEIETCLFNIIKDNKIDSKDIPEIILLFKKLYTIIHKLKEFKFNTDKLSETCGSILIFIIHTLVADGKIKIAKENQIDFLDQTDKLVETCVSLLKLSKSLKTSSCFCKFFCCK